MTENSDLLQDYTAQLTTAIHDMSEKHEELAAVLNSLKTKRADIKSQLGTLKNKLVKINGVVEKRERERRILKLKIAETQDGYMRIMENSLELLSKVDGKDHITVSKKGSDIDLEEEEAEGEDMKTHEEEHEGEGGERGREKKNIQ